MKLVHSRYLIKKQYFLISCFLLTLHCLLGFSHIDKSFLELDQQRVLYYEAREAFKKNKHKEYRRLKKKLKDYPLVAYLDYRELTQDISLTPRKKIEQFLKTHTNSYLGDQLRFRWLSHLAANNQWHDYINYYQPTDRASYRCLYVWARYKTGDKKALRETVSLWNVRRSQPAQCDPLFKEWQEKGLLTDAILWSRFRKVARNGNQRLARFLKNNMPEKLQNDATLYLTTYKKLALLEKTNSYKQKNKRMRDIVADNMERYGRKKPPQKALKLWRKYQKIHKFDKEQKANVNGRLAVRFAHRNDYKAVEKLLKSTNEKQKIRAIEIIIREYLERKAWKKVLTWINKLPQQAQASDRWQYWRARALASKQQRPQEVKKIFTRLASEQNFYGYLSADILEKPYALSGSASIVPYKTLYQLEQFKGLERARELFLLNEMDYARREWSAASHHFSNEQWIAAAQLAFSWGWYRKSIESMAKAKAWEDLRIRFPLAHKTAFVENSRKAEVPASLTLAIARQESAWTTDAQSRAGAMGLMQILPRTARYTARKAGIPHKKKDLMVPEHNIELGSHYISDLLKQYSNNRILAAAAYNAGPGRIQRWRKRTDSQLNYDMWIEVIPFNETRKYVQNILSYSMIYANQLGQKPQLIQTHERKQRL